MLKLDQTTRKLQAVLSGAVTTNQLPCMVSYSDDNGTTYVGGTQLTNTNSTTAVDICAAPGASTVRDIDYLSIRNRDTAAATVTVMLDDNGTDYEIVKAALAVGNQLIYTHGDGWMVIDAGGNLKTSATGSAGKLVQRVEATPYTTYTSGSYVIPYDNTIPQNTEGGEFLTATITPTSSTNRLVIDCTFNGTPATSATVAIALFQDSTANALNAAATNFGAGYHQIVSLHHEMEAGTTSATTFKIRAGTNTGGSLAINGIGANRIFGGVYACTLSVMEIST